MFGIVRVEMHAYVHARSVGHTHIYTELTVSTHSHTFQSQHSYSTHETHALAVMLKVRLLAV